MEGVERTPRVWIWSLGGSRLGGGGGRECGHLGHSACGVWGHPDGVNEQTFGRSWGEPGTAALNLPNPSLSTEMESLCSALAVLGLRGVGAAFHLLPHLCRLALPHCSGEPHGRDFRVGRVP